MNDETTFSLMDLINNDVINFEISNGTYSECVTLDSVLHANWRGHSFNYSYYLPFNYERLFYLTYDLDIEFNYLDYVKEILNDPCYENDFEFKLFVGVINSTVLLNLIDNEETIKQLLKFETVVINCGLFDLKIKPLYNEV